MSIAPASTGVTLSVVVIGRNEGPRLERCLTSIARMDLPRDNYEVIYVDSASTDGSAARARVWGAHVKQATTGLSAALARNLGWTHAAAPWILFLDGDTEVAPDFVSAALPRFDDPRVAVVFGNRRERHPNHSVYNRVLDLDWIVPEGEVAACGGDALIRRSALTEVGGYRAELIAGEEPDLCCRLRSKGYVVLHLDRPMTTHDLAITSFRQYWRRQVRTGHAYAEVSSLHRRSAWPIWVKESRANVIKGLFFVLLAAGSPAVSLAMRAAWPLALAAGLVLALAGRTARNARCKCPNTATLLLYGLHSHLQQLPILLGQFTYWANRWRGRSRALIEYKTPSREVQP
jgi:cellulose synthase/poly-beta-1,6-N-acetylglucosamine synthase-like glycosyltransferase